jgi:hypothetical protein
MGWTAFTTLPLKALLLLLLLLLRPLLVTCCYTLDCTSSQDCSVSTRSVARPLSIFTKGKEEVEARGIVILVSVLVTILFYRLLAPLYSSPVSCSVSSSVFEEEKRMEKSLKSQGWFEFNC